METRGQPPAGGVKLRLRSDLVELETPLKLGALRTPELPSTRELLPEQVEQDMEQDMPPLDLRLPTKPPDVLK